MWVLLECCKDTHSLYVYINYKFIVQMMLFLPTNGKNQSLLALTVSHMLNVGAELMMFATQLKKNTAFFPQNRSPFAQLKGYWTA